MMTVLNILYVGILFSVFLCLLFLPFGLLVWGVRRWYATHSLRRLSWRQRRALLGLELLWTAASSRLSRWQRNAALAVLLSLLLALFLSWLNAALYCDTPEALTVHALRQARHAWLNEGCPHLPDPQKYIGMSSSFTSCVCSASLVVKDRRFSEDRTYRGLFALRDKSLPNIYVIATTGEILVLEDSGKAQLLRAE